MSLRQNLYVSVLNIEAAPQGSKKHVGRGRLVTEALASSRCQRNKSTNARPKARNL
jgi:hypothetical protein